MTFTMARCETCLQYINNIGHIVSYRLGTEGRVQVDLGGEQPWSGVRVVCLPCVKFLNDLATRKSEKEEA